ncbi:MAG: tyrosine-type recombinase/integrase [Bacteroidales bacterium]
MEHKGLFLQYLKNQKRYSSHTLRAYSDDLGQYFDFINHQTQNCDFLAAGHKLIRQWIAHLMDNSFSARSVRRKISALQSFYKYLLKEGIVKNNPVKRVTIPKTEKRLPAFISAEKMDMLLDHEHFGDDFKGLRNRLILDMFYQTGIRLNELINLKISNTDLDNRQIKVLGKRNKERIIPITTNLEKLINTYNLERDKIDQDGNPYLFITEKGQKLYPRLVYRVVTSGLGIVTTSDKKNPHILRHTFATQMLNAGADLNAIKEILGHSNLSATEIYTHNTFKKLKSIYKQAHPRA